MLGQLYMYLIRSKAE